jgi:peptide deformylase
VSRKILIWPNKRLNDASAPVTEFGPELRTLADEMFELMWDAGGIGLAAIQVGESVRMFVEQFGDYEPRVYVNPVWVPSDPFTAGRVRSREGCLSVPGFFEDVWRFSHVKCTYQDLEGNRQTMLTEASAGAGDLDRQLRAQLIQHECEHLDGHIFLEHLSAFRREQIRRALSRR